jgi:NAD(P)-dependent dehydrogenase (short-subunit alcohol dehydrogenase family)
VKGVVVTGGTGALGRPVVLELLRAGHAVAVPYRGQDGFDRLQALAGDEASRLWGRPADLGDRASARAFVDEAAGRLGGRGGLACLAGGWRGSGPLEQTLTEEWDEMFRVNLATVETVVRATLPHLLAGGGSVVTVGARAADTGSPGASAYVAAKAAVMALTRTLALENRDRGVRFNCILPAVIDTPANRQAMPKADPSRWTSPEAIARVVAFLLSPASAPLSGALLPVDGRA